MHQPSPQGHYRREGHCTAALNALGAQIILGGILAYVLAGSGDGDGGGEDNDDDDDWQVQGWESSSIFTGLAVYWVALILAYVLAALYLILAILFVYHRPRAVPAKSPESPEASKNSTSSQAGQSKRGKALPIGSIQMRVYDE